MKYFLTLIMAVIIAVSGFAQTNKYFDAPFGGGGGFVAGWHIPQIDPLNLKLKEIGFPELSTSGMFTSGGAGFIYIGFVKNLRIGGMGFGGSVSSSTKVGNENLESIYSLGGGGVTVEYTLPFIKNIGVSVGAIIGGGSHSVEFYKNDGSFDWDDILGNENNVSRKIESSYWIFSPTLNAEFPVYRFAAIRLGVGYHLTLAGDWQAENGQSIINVPSDFKSDGFFIQLGLIAGFFAF